MAGVHPSTFQSSVYSTKLAIKIVRLCPSRKSINAEQSFSVASEQGADLKTSTNTAS